MPQMTPLKDSSWLDHVKPLLRLGGPLIVNYLAVAGMQPLALEVNGHDEDFPFYITCLAKPSMNETAIRLETGDEIISSRQSAMKAFSELRACQPRPV